MANKSRFGPPEKRNWVAISLFIAFILVVGAGIVWMATHSAREPSLTCRPMGAGSWSSFGRCTTD